MKITIKRFLYILCFLMLCYIDQRKGSADGPIQFLFTNLTGISIGLLLLSRSTWKDFLKLPYCIWTSLCIVIIPISTLLLLDSIHYMGQWISGALCIFLYGLLSIRLIFRIFVEQIVPPIKKPYFILWIILMVLMCLSKNDSLWHFGYFWLYTLLYTTDFSKEELKMLLLSLQNGIIIAFFLIQGWSFLFRPYDVLRYLGAYTNPNANALFYSIVYTAFLGKFCYYLTNQILKYRKIILVLSLAFSGAMWSFVLLTLCRSAMVGMAFATMLAGIYLLYYFKNKILIRGAALILSLIACLLISFPLVYSAVRYLPAVHPRPHFFTSDAYSEEKIHSWDPWNSDKYTTWEEVLKGNFDRIYHLFSKEQISTTLEGTTSTTNLYFSPLISSNQYVPSIAFAKNEPTNEALNNTLFEHTTNSINIRMAIYKYYTSLLNLTGHTNSENGLQVSSDYYAPHAHNLFLQISFNYGILAGILFVIWVGFTLFAYLRISFSRRNEMSIFALMSALIFINIILFGMTEFMWSNGQLSFTLLFLLASLGFHYKNL